MWSDSGARGTARAASGPGWASLTDALARAEAALRAGDLQQAEVLYDGLLSRVVPALHVKAILAARRGAIESAAALFRTCCDLEPGVTSHWIALGQLLIALDRFDAACDALTSALATDPDAADAHILLGLVHHRRGSGPDADSHFERALDLAPDHPAVWNTLGAIRLEQGRLTEAATAFRRSVAIQPDDAEIWSNLGVALHDQGLTRDGSDSLGRAMSIAPESLEIASNGLFYSNCMAEVDPDEIAVRHRRWGDAMAGSAAAYRQEHLNHVDPERSLRIGYVSPDFNEHSVAFFLGPLLRAHDPANCEVVCYSNGGRADWMTESLRRSCTTWRDIARLDDLAAASTIRRDRIDILIDLAGHSSGGRLSLFAQKAAPIQVTYLGYPNTTGVRTVDYRITDAFADPPGTTEQWHTEELVRPSSSFLCYGPPSDSPAVSTPPLKANRYATFGCFNHNRKLNPTTVARWSRVLHAVPASRLWLKSKPFGDTACRAEVVRWFGNQGIDSDRIGFGSFQPTLFDHLDSYRLVDVALDTFPYNGTTTTCEALWMGVPVVTLAGRDHRSRVGLSLLRNVGLGELAAETEDAFVSIAIGLATNLENLEELRRSMRERLRGSPLLDSARFAKDLEFSYRTMWRRWCDTSSSPGAAQ